MEKIPPKNVDTYIEASVVEGQEIMKELRNLIKLIVPEVSEEISWNVPIYKYHGILAGYSVAKNHVSFGVDILAEAERKLLKEHGYKTGKKTIQIKFKQKVPKVILKKIIKKQAEFNEAKQTEK